MSFLKSLVRDIFNNLEDKIRDSDPAGSIASPKESLTFIPGDISILNISLVSGDGKRSHNLMPLVTEFHIYESIIYPSIFCDMLIADSIRMYEDFPLTTDEYVTVSYKTPGSNAPIKHTFAVNRVSDKVQQPNSKIVTYTLQLVSPELKRAAGMRTIKSFTGTISELVQSVLKDNIKTRKNIRIEESTGIIDTTIGPRFPFAIIHEYYLDADNRRDDNGVYTFFENRKGYNLVTFEKLIKDGQKNIFKKSFEFVTDRNSNASVEKYRNILAYNQVQFTDAISLTVSGGLNNSGDSYDPARGRIQSANYTESKDGGKLPTSDKEGTNLLGTNFIQQYEKDSIVNKLIAVNSETRPNSNIAEVLVKRTAFLKRLQQIEAQIFIYGDSDLAVGDVIECKFPQSSDAKDDKDRTRLDSGNYLITHLRHMILNTDRPQHVISCNLMKAGMSGK